MDDIVARLSSGRPDLRASLEQMEAYQLEAIEFANQNRRILIGDEMGLGKSAQGILSCEVAQAYPLILVTKHGAKDSLLNECRKWVPWRSAAVAETDLPQTDIIIVNPESLGRHIENLLQLGAKGLILDESHVFKNHNAKRSQHASRLAASIPFRILMTATVIKNRPPDLIHQLRLLDALDDVLRYHPEYALLRSRGRNPDDQRHAELLIESFDRLALHRALTATIMVRRTAEQVIANMPTLKRHTVQITSDQTVYREAEREFLNWLKDASEHGDHKRSSGRFAIQTEAHFNTLRQAAAMSKIAAVVEWAAGMKAANRKVLLFTYHRPVAEAISQALPGRAVMVHGGIKSLDERRAICASLAQNDFLVGTMDSIGEAIDGLQKMSAVVAFIELDYTPTKHQQAEGRLRRWGQPEAHVDAYYFTLNDSSDEAIMETLNEKWRDNEAIVDGSEIQTSARFTLGLVRRLIAEKPWLSGHVQWKRQAAPGPLAGVKGSRSLTALPLGMSPQHGPCTMSNVSTLPLGGLLRWTAILDVNGRQIEVKASDGPIFVRDAQTADRFHHSAWLLKDEAFATHLAAVNRHQEGVGSPVMDADKFLWALKVGSDRWRECQALAALGTVVAQLTSAGARREVLPETFNKARIREIEQARPGWIVLNEYLDGGSPA